MLLKKWSLNSNETALTMESAESCSEAEKKATDMIRQNQFRNAAALFNETIQKKINASIKTKENDYDKSSLQNSKTLQETGLSDSYNRRTLGDITNAGSVENNNSDLFVQTRTFQIQNVSPLVDQNEMQASVIEHRNSTEPLGPFTSASSSLSAEPPGVSKKGSDLSHQQLLSSSVIDDNQSTKKSNPKANPYKVLLGYMFEMMADIKQLREDNKELKAEIQNFKTLLTKNVTVTTEYIGTIKQICDKFDYKIPFERIGEFQTFDIDLQENESLREAVTNVLQTGLDPSFVLSRSIVNMLKMFLSREVASKYVAVKKIKEKYVMKTTAFFHCIEALIKERRSISNLETNDKDLITALSNVLSNAASWYLSKKTDINNLSNLKEPEKRNHSQSVPTNTEEEEISDPDIILTGYEFIDANDGTMRVLATKSSEPQRKCP